MRLPFCVKIDMATKTIENRKFIILSGTFDDLLITNINNKNIPNIVEDIANI